MAAIVQANRIAAVAPPGMEVSDLAYATEDIKAGDLVVITGGAPPSQVYTHAIALADGTEAHGVALVDCNTGGTAEYSTQNEFDGYSGLTPGAPLTVVDGKLDDTAPATGVAVQARAVTTTRIRVNFL